jgi:G3E family GTPase
VTSADLLILNKVDLVTPAELPGIEARLRAVEPDAPIIRATQCHLDPDLLFPPGATVGRRQRDTPTERDHAHDRFRHRQLTISPKMASEDIVQMLRQLGALRIKGFVSTRRASHRSGCCRPHSIDAVGL